MVLFGDIEIVCIFVGNDVGEIGKLGVWDVVVVVDIDDFEFG